MKGRMFLHPHFDRQRVVCGLFVQNEMQLSFSRRLFLDEVENLKQFHGTVALEALHNLSVINVKCRKTSRGTMTHKVMRECAGHSLLH